ncbi:MAG: OadG family transporter subunit [Paludibacter sp.]|nr:OadG family transporter subunit [Paludibacter sp.]
MMNILAINWANALDIVGFGISMVFILLILLVIVLSLFSKAIAPKVRIPKKNQVAAEATTTAPDNNIEYEEGHLSANDSAAIAMALHLYYAEVHDEESAIITIKTVERRYSPWSSKIYGLNNLVK